MLCLRPKFYSTSLHLCKTYSSVFFSKLFSD
uniref:Uncharacterized protein n=1 Tax=Anguilla anguilla TaxID=7936 RepID=A0A0E9PMW2_ANGAN